MNLGALKKIGLQMALGVVGFILYKKFLGGKYGLPTI